MIGKRVKEIKMRGGERNSVNKKIDKTKNQQSWKASLSVIYLSVKYVVQFPNLCLWKSSLRQAKTKQLHEGIR